jgi:hypothetical protein
MKIATVELHGSDRSLPRSRNKNSLISFATDCIETLGVQSSYPERHTAGASSGDVNERIAARCLVRLDESKTGRRVRGMQTSLSHEQLEFR